MFDDERRIVHDEETVGPGLPGPTLVPETATSVNVSASSPPVRSVAQRFITGVLLYIFGLQALRIILALIGINHDTGFAGLIYALSNPYHARFATLLGRPISYAGPTTGVFEVETLVAMVFYALIGWGILKLLTRIHSTGRTQMTAPGISAAEHARLFTNPLLLSIFGPILGLLALRFILTFAGVNPFTEFAVVIYGGSSLFRAPFATLFGRPTLFPDIVRAGMVEVETLVAMLFYALLGWGISKLLAWMRDPTRRTDL